jgi:cephalosporin-C deacetylase-like acetyl esterase
MRNLLSLIFTAVMYVLMVSICFGQTPNNALPWRLNTAYNAYLLREVHQQYADRQTELTKALQSKNDMMLHKESLKDRYRKIMGELPPKYPLKSRVLKSSSQKGFIVEKIIFESLPKRYVTANLYLPVGKGPFPAVLELCGHGPGGKIGAPAEAILLAKNGIAVLVVDPIGQGERVQFLDKEGKPATRGATTEHTLLNAGCNLVGTSVAAWEWWDNHRAVDYLESRPDIDKNRLGVFGSSGGGTQATYLIGLEERFKVASVCSYFSKRERVLELNGPSDGCQHIPGEGAQHLEIADWITMFAPKPVLIMAGRYDFVDYQGVLEGHRELQRVYEILRAKNNIALFSTDGGHGMPKAKRESLATWFRTWLCKDTSAVKETELARVPDSDLQCSETGQVNTAFADAFSIPDYSMAMANQFAEGRASFLKQDEAVVRQKVLELLGIEPPSDKIRAEQTGVTAARNYTLYKYQLIRQGEFPLPCVVVMPEKVGTAAKVIISLNEQGKDALLNDETTLGHCVNQGDILVVADLRGYGETADPASLNDTKYWNREYRNAMISLHIGKSIVGQRVTDILSLVDFVKGDEQFAALPLQLFADGSYGPVAVHATYLEPRISKTEIVRSVKSYEEYLKNPLQRDVYTNVLYGVLKYYDLKDLAGLSGKGRVQYID